DSFWCKNVLSPSKLREKWDELSLKLSVPINSSRQEASISRASFEGVDYSLPENSGFRS
ncbi:helix-turn-helix domain-containing protein, partial [Klebsiella pneumoniae]